MIEIIIDPLHKVEKINFRCKSHEDEDLTLLVWPEIRPRFRTPSLPRERCSRPFVNETLHIYSTSKLEFITAYDDLSASAYRVVWNPDGSQLALSLRDTTIALLARPN